MTAAQFKEKFASRLATITDAASRLQAAAEELAVFFGVLSHEVGLFTVNRQQHAITFVWPAALSHVGHIPLTAVNSLVAKTANEKASYLDNAFAGHRHLFIFEHMLSEKSERIPVQKIMSAPVIVANETIGVVQITRKAVSPAEAGPDFSQQNLADLEAITPLLAGCLG
jgi:hypothetical protein